MIFFLIFMAFASASAQEHNVIIKIENAVTNEPLPGAEVHLSRPDRVFFADKNGTVSYRCSHSHSRLEVRYLGFEPVDTLLTSKIDGLFLISLQPVSYAMSEIEVYDRAVLYERSTISNIIKSKEVQENRSTTLAETIDHAAGISVRSMGPAPARPVIRGMSGVRVQINRDGMENTDLSATSPDHAVSIDPSGIEHVEIIRGPESLLYSSSSAGGVINVNSNKILSSVPEQIKAELNGGFQSMNMESSGGIRVSVPAGNFAFSGKYHKRLSGDIRSPNRKLGNTSIDIDDHFLSASYINDDLQSGVSWSEYSNVYGIPGGFTGAHPFGVDIDIFKRDITGKFSYDLSGSIFDNLRLNLERTYYHHTEYEKPGLIGAEFVLKNHKADIYADHSLGNTHNGTIGASASLKENKIGGFVFTPPVNKFSTALFWFNKFKFENFKLETSLRYEYSHFKPEYSLNVDNDALDNRAFHDPVISVQISKELTGSFETGFFVANISRAPSIEELYNRGPHLAAYSYETGNPGLDNERGYTAELFAEYKRNDLRLKSSVFYNDYSNFIFPRATGDTNWSSLLPVYAMQGNESLITGFEIQGSYRFFDHFKIRGNAAYIYGEMTAIEQPLPMIPPLSGNLSLEFNGNFFFGKLSAEYAFDQNRVYRFEEETAGYAVLAVSGGYRHKYKDFLNVFSIKFHNLRNTVYRNHLSRIKSIFPEPGFNVKLNYDLYY